VDILFLQIKRKLIFRPPFIHTLTHPILIVFGQFEQKMNSRRLKLPSKKEKQMLAVILLRLEYFIGKYFLNIYPSKKIFKKIIIKINFLGN